jgi:ABC-type nitrate/sulfonate/bicarbonate transport system substrate-binding protein
VRRFFPFLALGVLTIGALSVVGLSLGNNSSTSSSATTIRFVYDFPGPDFALVPLVVAEKKGYFADQGLKVDVTFPPTTSTTALELSQGAGDIGFVTTTDMAVAVANKIPLVSVANYSMHNNWALFAKPGSKLSLATLKGKSVFSYGDTWTNAMLSFVLKKAGLTTKDITITSGTNDIPLILNGRVDVSTSTTNYELAGFNDVTSQKPEMILGTTVGAPDVPVWVYSVTNSWGRAHAGEVTKFLAAIKRGTQWAVAHPADAATLFDQAYPKSGYTNAYNALGWKLTIPFLTNATGDYFTQTAQQWSTIATALKNVGVTSSASPASSYYTNAYLPR